MSAESLAENLISRLEQLTARHRELEYQMSQPAIASDAARLTELAKERGRLDKLVTVYRQYTQAKAELDEAQQIAASDQSDPDLLQLAREELPTLQANLARTVEQIKQALVSDDDLDVDSCIMEIRAGIGGSEAALFARDLYQMYTRYAESCSWKTEVINFSPTSSTVVALEISGAAGVI